MFTEYSMLNPRDMAEYFGFTGEEVKSLCSRYDRNFQEAQAWYASDVASSWDVVKEVLKKYQEMGIVFDTFTLLQPTSPLRKYEDIKKAYELFKEKDAIAVVSVCEMEHSPLWSNTLPENNSLSGFLRADSNKQRQKLETFYRINGAIYMADVKAFLENTNLYREDCYAYKMPAERSIDIDTELDFKIAETIINQ